MVVAAGIRCPASSDNAPATQADIDPDIKTNRSRRTLKLPEIAVEALRGRRERQAAERAEAGESWQEHGLADSPVMGAAGSIARC